MVLAHQTAFHQSRQHIAHHGAADVEMAGKFGFHDAVLAEDHAARDIGFNEYCRYAPGRAALQRLIGMGGNGKPKVRISARIGSMFLPAGPTRKPRPAKRCTRFSAFQPLQRPAHRHARDLQNVGNRPSMQARDRAVKCRRLCLPQHGLSDFISLAAGADRRVVVGLLMISIYIASLVPAYRIPAVNSRFECQKKMNFEYRIKSLLSGFYQAPRAPGGHCPEAGVGFPDVTVSLLGF